MTRLTTTLQRMLFDAYTMTRYPRNGVGAYRLCDTTRDLCGCGNHWQSHVLNRTLCWWENLIMARGKKQNDNQSFTPISFVQCNLSAQEKKEFAKWAVSERENMDTLVVEILQSGHKLGWSFNDNSDSFIVSITGKPDGCINASKCNTSHAKDYLTAMWVALFKFHVIWRKGVWEDIAPEEDFG
jgi:hypothetical protein